MQCTECDSSREKQHCPIPHTMTLFVDDTGCPLRFFIRPGNAKRRFLPVIKLGGGVMCRIQEPGAISLADPKEQSGVAAPGYISVQYILDCVEKNERLDLEGYRLGSTQQERADSTSSGLCWTGRVGYSREEDDAILQYLKEHSSKESLVRGNKIWQEMERAAVTCHTWQSMKDRYRKHLAGRMEAFQVEDLAATPSNAATCSTEKKSKLEETEAMDTSSDQEVNGPACASVENQAVEQEEMKEPTNGAEKEEEVLEKEVSDTEVEILQGQEVTVESAQLTQSSSAKRRKLGILELAIREFESGDETPDLEDLVTGEARDQEEAGAQSVVAGQESVPVAGRAELGQPQSPVSLLSKFMMHKDSFIVDSQTQDGEEGVSDPSEAEVEDAIAAVQFLMDEFGVDLACVMQSLLKNSGDFQAVRHYLRTGRRADGRPPWTRHDDLALQSGDPATKQALIFKYGEESVAKRVAFFNT
ncbi:telomeric repeat-binding factor 2-interacting protein 1-like isoform X1 [Acipenser oxyrinchus oxyrinchus]|uniref:Telomeric repeat-binding factor 2-interacting protein 1 n=1 Tax=Acipenser oxyrinchus oxyrinchus TaxID=40147 RepID=A0AAD8CZV6_ACIOX|nr:telomeric repeat-binding factor 2-interacting protein 1-like isoform X1 [Acipenser oxyrinchus oxyrinchus]